MELLFLCIIVCSFYVILCSTCLHSDLVDIFFVFLSIVNWLHDADICTVVIHLRNESLSVACYYSRSSTRWRHGHSSCSHP